MVDTRTRKKEIKQLSTHLYLLRINFTHRHPLLPSFHIFMPIMPLPQHCFCFFCPHNFTKKLFRFFLIEMLTTKYSVLLLFKSQWQTDHKKKATNNNLLLVLNDTHPKRQVFVYLVSKVHNIHFDKIIVKS